MTKMPGPGGGQLHQARDGRDMTWVEGTAFAVVTACAYIVMVLVNGLLPSTRLVTGVDLFFLPAGVKFLAIMLGRGWSIPGLWAANFLMSLREWEGTAPSRLLLDSGAWTLITYALIVLLLRLFAIRPELGNLSYLKFLAMVLLASLGHGCLYNLYMVMLEHRLPEDGWRSAMGMALGDFLGTSALLLTWLMLARAARLLRQRHGG